MSDELFRILLVEDNDADAYLFRKGLTAAGLNFELIVITDGAEALAFVRREGKHAERPVPDLAVMDLNLPKNDGSEVLEALRQREEWASVPVVITSSSTSPRDRTKVERLGIERYLRKPPDLEEFLQMGEVLKQILLESKGHGTAPAKGKAKD
jgi:chemotaxis family two-component system response regulator Rcp1